MPKHDKENLGFVVSEAAPSPAPGTIAAEINFPAPAPPTKDDAPETGNDDLPDDLPALFALLAELGNSRPATRAEIIAHRNNGS